MLFQYVPWVLRRSRSWFYQNISFVGCTKHITGGQKFLTGTLYEVFIVWFDLSPENLQIQTFLAILESMSTSTFQAFGKYAISLVHPILVFYREYWDALVKIPIITRCQTLGYVSLALIKAKFIRRQSLRWRQHWSNPWNTQWNYEVDFRWKLRPK